MSVDYFAGRLRELREAKGLTREQLADAVELSVGAIRDFEQQKRFPSWATVLAVCKALGTDPNAFTVPPSDEAASPRPRGRPRKGSSTSPESETKGEE